MTNKAVIIGGSAGSFQVVIRILSQIPKSFPYPLFLCLHRLKHVREGFVEALSIKSNITILEPNDKDRIKPGIAYLAPSNYHLLIEPEFHFALSSGEPINHSRPSIDLSFASAAYAYRNNLTGIILSGANKDGALGLKAVADFEGTTIVQDPNDCQIRTMTESAIKTARVDHVLSTDQIIAFLAKMTG
ncbi:MAG: chemotaxis protein CheB [Bacteroidetes bacterium RIFOXYA12_FULL_35_11]|nr:MAG: chemotaxis protein CheB [Bacteroidetes bacterium GWF2_35_48]OFY82399.1 MAG: chemotaxis protein CheB [Bacteroidetes bacterium RIFOXYA12_FULL_35_11]OFY92600.1 MAG: chemotaxis protein CheB [Bacteroidetes bacterium RIFOXYC12_FULL_35_7]OFY95537.1 MAG: chemotaxis protein CheB [Bacteroidetes bacterium RIFOXYB2_FULL_35_7]HBX51881.1 chemotaxis protein CheB [Bacteroidales bacterium]